MQRRKNYDTYYGLNNCVSPKFYVKAITFNVVVVGNGTFREVMRVKWGHDRRALI